MKNKTLLAYRVVTGVFTLFIGMGVMMYIFNTPLVRASYEEIGYPVYLIYVLATLKTLGLLAIWLTKSKVLKEWAYFGFFINLSLGTLAHIMVNDGKFAPALFCLVLIITSYLLRNKIEKS